MTALYNEFDPFAAQWLAMLCRAFYDGWDEREHHDLYAQHGYRVDQQWSPGCGKAAP